MSILGRAVAYVVLAVALLAAAVTLNDAKYPVRDAGKPELSAPKSDADAELARCKAIGLETADPACNTAWQANRNRFFRSAKPYQDRLTDTFTTESKEAAAPVRVDPDSSRSATTQNSPDRPGDTMGRPK
jgi:conjugative transfer region protein TrbK